MEIEIVYNGNELYFIEKKIQSAIDRFANITADKIKDEMKGESPIQTGDLRRSIKSKPLTRMQAIVYSNLHYAGIVNDGRGEIEAKNGGSLNFRINGQMVHVKRVGPAAPNPYVQRGIDRVHQFDALLDQALREVGL